VDASYRFAKNWSASAACASLIPGLLAQPGRGQMELDLGQVITANLGLSWTF